MEPQTQYLSLDEKALAFITKYSEELLKGVGGDKLVKMRKEFFGGSYEPKFLKALGQYCYVWNNGFGANPGCCLKESLLGRQIEENVKNGYLFAPFGRTNHKLMKYSIKNIIDT